MRIELLESLENLGSTHLSGHGFVCKASHVTRSIHRSVLSHLENGCTRLAAIGRRGLRLRLFCGVGHFASYEALLLLLLLLLLWSTMWLVWSMLLLLVWF